MNGRIAQIGRFLSTVFRGNNELFSHKHPRLLNGTQVNRKASSRMENAFQRNKTSVIHGPQQQRYSAHHTQPVDKCMKVLSKCEKIQLGSCGPPRANLKCKKYPKPFEDRKILPPAQSYFEMRSKEIPRDLYKSKFKLADR